MPRSTGEPMATTASRSGFYRRADLGSQHLYRQGRRHFSPLMAPQPIGNREESPFNQHRVFVFLSTSACIGGLRRFQPDHQSSMTVVPPLCGGL